MDDEIEVPEYELRPNVSLQLKQAREAAGLTIKDIAARTRVPIRHLENLESENFSALPGLTYVLGFVRNYARTLEIDEAALVAQLRDELSDDDSLRRYGVDPVNAPADPARIPPKTFAWGAIGVLALILIGFGIFKAMSSGLFTPADEPVAEVADVPKDTAAEPVATAQIGSASGPVVLTASDDVWLSIYTEDGSKLLEKLMTKGESYTVPADAKKPMILTGAPQALAVTVGGKAVPALGTGNRSIKDVVLTPEALLAQTAPTGQSNKSAPAPSTE